MLLIEIVVTRYFMTEIIFLCSLNDILLTNMKVENITKQNGGY